MGHKKRLATQKKAKQQRKAKEEATFQKAQTSTEGKAKITQAKAQVRAFRGEAPAQAQPTQQQFDQAQTQARAGLAPATSQELATQQNQDFVGPPAPTPFQAASAQAQAKPGGLQNVKDVLLIALNPFSKGKITANVENPLLRAATEFTANNPFSAALTLTGLAGIGRGLASLGAKTAVGNVAKVGTKGLYRILPSGTVGKFATNSATRAVTASWLSRLVSASTNPQFVVGTLMAAIGSYPFAGFIKEEAVQTLGFALNTAHRNNDIEGGELAIQAQEDILDPSLEDEIKSKTPFANVIFALEDFFEASRIKLGIDKKLFSDLKQQLETGETNDERLQRNTTEEETDYKANIDYYNSERQKLLAWEAEAKRKNREEDAKFWATERAKQRKLEEADRKAIADFWTQYRKAQQKLNEENRPSKLNFGLL